MSASNALFLIVGILVYLAFIVGMYVLCTFGVWRMASHAGVPHAWLAFVPFGNAYVVGMLADRAIYTFTGLRRRLSLWCPVSQGIAFVGMFLVIGFALVGLDFGVPVALALILCLVGSLAAVVLYFYATFYIFRDYAPDNAVLYTVLGILFGIYWIFQMVEMNTVPVSVTGFGSWPGGRPKYDRYHQWSPASAPGSYPGYPGQPGGVYTTNPNQQSYTTGQPQGGYPGQTTNPGQQPYQNQQPYQGQGPQFYQGQGGYYQPSEQPQRPRDEGENNGPELK